MSVETEPTNQAFSFVNTEHAILDFWKKEKIFERSLEQTKDNPPYIFYDGPPFANGKPHYGHILPGTIKDVIPRYKTMRGFHVDRQWGWDCHGLPVESMVQKENDLQTSKDIENFGINKDLVDAMEKYAIEKEYELYVQWKEKMIEFMKG